MCTYSTLCTCLYMLCVNIFIFLQERVFYRADNERLGRGLREKSMDQNWKNKPSIFSCDKMYPHFII